MSIFSSSFGTFAPFCDNMIINMLDLKELFTLIQVNKYYNSKITDALPIYLASKYNNEYLINHAIYNNNSTLLNIMISKIVELNNYERNRVLRIAYKYSNARVINNIFISELIDRYESEPLLFFACVKGNVIGVENILNNFSMDRNEIAIMLCCAAYYNHKNIFDIVNGYNYNYNFNDIVEFRTSYKKYKTHPFILALSNGNYELAQYMFDKYDINNSKILDIALQTINLRDVALKIHNKSTGWSYYNDDIMDFISKIVIKYSNNIQDEDFSEPQDITDFDTQHFLDYLKQATMF